MRVQFQGKSKNLKVDIAYYNSIEVFDRFHRNKNKSSC